MIFFFKQKTAYEMLRSLVGSEMCIRDSAGLDGFRMVRGGSWMAVPEGCDAVTGATQLPLQESSIMGFRGVRGPAATPR